MSVGQTIDSVTFLGKSDPMQRIYKTIGRLCNVDCPLLLIGEPGSGKKIVAEALHYFSHRASFPFHILAGLDLKEAPDEDLLGIDETHPSDSTYYITDWASLPMFVQNQLLRIQKTGEYRCNHSNRYKKHNFRFIAASGANLRQEMDRSNVPVDVFYDWNFIPLMIPSLRERKSDIPIYSEYFLKLQSDRWKISLKELSPEAKEVLLGYNWPGNLDELKEVLRVALQNCGGNYIRPEHLPPLQNKSVEDQEVFAKLEMFLNSRLSSYIQSLPPSFSGNLYPFLVPLLERSVFDYVLKKSKGNKNKAAKLLGLHRNTLNKKLQRLDHS